MRLKALVALLVAIAPSLPSGCAGRDAVEPENSAKVEYLGDPVKTSLDIGHYVVERSFGGMEYIIYDPALNYDPDYLVTLKETERNIEYAIYRYADYLWTGLVKNNGDRSADSVYVRMTFAGGFVDSAYVSGLRVNPNQSVAYELYSRGDRVDSREIVWQDM
jgi:hypothetical protein